MLAELGFAAPIPINAEMTASLGVAGIAGRAMVARGAGSSRALVFEILPSADLRHEMGRIASRLSSRAPHLLWILVGIDSHGDEVGVASFDVSRPRPRVVALIARRGHIVDSDSETVCALAAAIGESDVHTHCRWLEILGRESVGRRFFRALEQSVRHLADSLAPPINRADASELSLLYVSRLLFLSFLETKGWLDCDHGFLGNRYAGCMVQGGGYHRRVLAPLFFGTLNTHPRNRAARARAFGRIPFLNGGLFARSPLETRTAGATFTDEALGDVFANLLTRYRFTAREDSSTWSEAAIDPEMLGKAFESLMSSSNRKTTGAFYTPQSLVSDVSRSALADGLECRTVGFACVTEALSGGIPRPHQRSALLAGISALRVLDPACGSGSFLVHILEQLSSLRTRLGDLRPLHVIRREILTTSIFGVDISPTAVWLCELRLWLSMAIEDPESDPVKVTPLPNLDRNIRVGDSLGGEAFVETAFRSGGRKLAAVRSRYTRATGPKKRSLARMLDRMERELALSAFTATTVRLRGERSELLAALRSRDLFGERLAPNAETRTRLARLRDELRASAKESRRLNGGGALPFSFATQFADVAAAGGFDVIAGNPPWVRTHNFDPRSRLRLKQSFAVYRNSAWKAGSDAAAAGRGFGSQVDVSALFIERSVELLRPGGTMALLVPAKLWRSLAGGGVRSFLLENTDLRKIRDLGSSTNVFDAAVYPSIVVANRRAHTLNDDRRDRPPVAVCVGEEASRNNEWMMCADRLPLDASRGAPWLLLPAEVRAAFDRVRGAGDPMAESIFGRPLLGVKTGCNDAFFVSGFEGSIERTMLRALVRGDRVMKWALGPCDASIIWTHDSAGAPLRSLPPAAMRWLSGWRRDLEARSDARGRARWWMLFRTEAADASLPRVVWSDIGRSPRAAVILQGDTAVPINSCYVARCPTLTDAHALTALLNSPLIAAWLGVVAEPARGGYRRYLGWTMSLLPIPHNWERARAILAPIGLAAFGGDEPSDSDLLQSALDAYGLNESTVAALLQWTA